MHTLDGCWPFFNPSSKIKNKNIVKVNDLSKKKWENKQPKQKKVIEKHEFVHYVM